MSSLSTTKAYLAIGFLFFNGLVTANDPSTYSQQKCFTRLAGTKPASIRTSTQAATLTLTIPAKATVTPTQTVTPASATATAVTTSTSIATEVLTQVTNTLTVTNTQTSYETSTSTAFTTQFTTSQGITVVTSTTTVAPPSGFTALGDQLQAAGKSYAKRDEQRNHPRDILAPLDARAAVPTCTSLRVGRNGPTLYPQAYPATMQCNKLVEVVKASTKFVTAKPTTVTAAQGTITSTSTSTITDTTTLTPLAASTTITESTSITLTTTTTSTSTIISTLTSISTSFAPQATYYAACAPNNLVNKIDGNSFAYLIFQPYILPSEVSVTTVSSAYDCCVQCISQSSCADSAFAPEQSYCETYSPANGAVAQIGVYPEEIDYRISNGYRPFFKY